MNLENEKMGCIIRSPNQEKLHTTVVSRQYMLLRTCEWYIGYSLLLVHYLGGSMKQSAKPPFSMTSRHAMVSPTVACAQHWIARVDRGGAVKVFLKEKVATLTPDFLVIKWGYRVWLS